jgi:hypothetical protein
VSGFSRTVIAWKREGFSRGFARTSSAGLTMGLE